MDQDFPIEHEYYIERPRPKRRFKFQIKPLPDDKPLINLVLFLLTVLATFLTFGLWYSIAIMLFLLSHEMGHYLMCKRYGIRATLPFFIPLPIISPFGTMGAFIQIKGFIPSKKALFDVGAAGPLAGFIVAIPVTIIGIYKSSVQLADTTQEGLKLGEPLLFKVFTYLIKGPVPEGYDVFLHPLAYAGWVGLFVTALNLIPIGQLDGGHVFYSMFGQFSRKTNYVFLGIFAIMTFFYHAWVAFLILLLLLGRSHPSPLDNYTPIDFKRRLLGYFIFIIFILTFTPTPFII